MAVKKERVVIGNQEFLDEDRRTSNFGWGIFLIIAGIILLLNSIGFLPWQVWNYYWQFWPVLLILGGIHVILGHNMTSNMILAMLSLIVFVLIAVFGAVQVKRDLRNSLPDGLRNVIDEMEGYKKPWRLD